MTTTNHLFQKYKGEARPVEFSISPRPPDGKHTHTHLQQLSQSSRPLLELPSFSVCVHFAKQ